MTLPSLLAVVLAYQLVGSLGEWAIVGNLHTALQDFRMGFPGMALQWLGGYLLLKNIKD